MSKKVFIFLAVLVLAILACTISTAINSATQQPAGGVGSPQTTTSGEGVGTTQPTAVDGNNPAPTASEDGSSLSQSTATGGGNSLLILFQDDFSDANSGWDHITTENGTADYATGGYEIKVNASTLSMWANPSRDFPNDIRIEVDATKIGGPDDNAFGVQCRYQDAENFYFFYISSDGYVGIGIDKAGTKTYISNTDGRLVNHSSIIQGAATNHLRVDCIGSTLTLYVNNIQAATATDSSFIDGDAGLIARTYSTGGTDILFSNFFVYKP